MQGWLDRGRKHTLFSTCPFWFEGCGYSFYETDYAKPKLRDRDGTNCLSRYSFVNFNTLTKLKLKEIWRALQSLHLLEIELGKRVASVFAIFTPEILLKPCAQSQAEEAENSKETYQPDDHVIKILSAPARAGEKNLFTAISYHSCDAQRDLPLEAKEQKEH